MNLRLNPTQRAALFALKQRPWSSPQKLADMLDLTPQQAGNAAKQLHLAGAAELQQEKQMVREGTQRRTKLVRTYRLTEKGRMLAAKVTPEEVTQFTATQDRKRKPAAATASKGEASTREKGRQYTKKGHKILTCEEVNANIDARFEPGEWFIAKSVRGSYAVMEELERRGDVEGGKPDGTSVRTWRRPRKK
jgi:DNA-binding MarR family transcriptional regulator